MCATQKYESLSFWMRFVVGSTRKCNSQKNKEKYSFSMKLQVSKNYMLKLINNIKNQLFCTQNNYMETCFLKLPCYFIGKQHALVTIAKENKEKECVLTKLRSFKNSQL